MIPTTHVLDSAHVDDRRCADCRGRASRRAGSEAAAGFDTDRTVTGHRGARLTIDNDAGEVVVRTWDRDSLRIQARHSAQHDRRADQRTTSSPIRSRGSRALERRSTTKSRRPAWLPVRVERPVSVHRHRGRARRDLRRDGPRRHRHQRRRRIRSRRNRFRVRSSSRTQKAASRRAASTRLSGSRARPARSPSRTPTATSS